jgi:hypothetical protein
VVDNLIRLPKISEVDLDKAERDIREFTAWHQLQHQFV